MIINNNYRYTKSAYAVNKKISFGTIEREVIEDKKLKYRNDTYFFRDDIDWNRLTRHIVSSNTPKKIYCYACSDGSEPYSIAISLISKLGYDKAQEYFPIIAKDNDEYMVKKAQSGYIELDTIDIIRMNENTGNAPYSFFSKISPSSIHDDYYLYKVDDKLKKCVCFSKGNLVNEVSSLDYSNSVIFFRNVWPYLNKEQQKAIVKSLSQKMEKSTMLITGIFDYNERLNPKFNKWLSQFGLLQISPFIYKKCSLKNPINLARHISSDFEVGLKKLQLSISHIFNSQDFF